MKYALLQLGVLTAIIVAAVLGGAGVAADRWGAAGVRSLYAAAWIVWVAAILGALPLGIAAAHWPEQAPLVAFAGTAVRLLGTGAGALVYQTIAQPHLVSFLAALLVLYLALLAVETGLIVYIVLRVCPKRPARPQ